MSPVDILIILLVLAAGFQSYQLGAIQQVCRLFCILIGLSLGTRISIYIIKNISSSFFRLTIAIVVTTLITLGLLILGVRFGRRLRTKAPQTRLYKLDKYIGIFVGAMGALILCWFGSLTVLSFHSANAQNTILSSKIIMYIDGRALSYKTEYKLFYLINPDHDFNIGQIEPGKGMALSNSIAPDLPFSGPFSQELTRDYNGVVYITNSACNVYGSGYISSPDIIVTASHVVRGSSSISVTDMSGHSYLGRVILFDPGLDVAAIYVPGLTDKPLSTNTSLTGNVPVAALGFPGGSFDFSIGNIYGDADSSEIKQVNLSDKDGVIYYFSDIGIREGYSGGPLIAQSGSVIAENIRTYFTSTPILGTQSNGNFALSVSTSDYYSELLSSEVRPHRVSTGYCANG